MSRQFRLKCHSLVQLNNQCDPHDQHHILRLRDSFIHKNHLCLVFELLSSNLYELIKQNQFQGLSTQLVKVFTAQLLDALTILKDARLIHCDLKPENILLDYTGHIALCDFGLCKLNMSETEKTNSEWSRSHVRVAMI